MGNGKVIAVNGNLELIKDSEIDGHVRDKVSGTEYPSHSIMSILSKGDWEFSDDNISNNEILKEKSGVIICLDCSYVKFISNFPDKEDKHITLLFMGDAEKVNKDDVISKLDEFAYTHAPISGEFNGTAVFFDSGNGFPLVSLYDSAELPRFRDELMELFPTFEQNHGFTPHMTLDYASTMDEAFLWGSAGIAAISNPEMHTFTSISFWYGDEHYNFQLHDVTNKEIRMKSDGELVIRRYDEPDRYDISKNISEFYDSSKYNSTLKKMVIIDDDFLVQTLIRKEVGEILDVPTAYSHLFAKSNEYFMAVNKTFPTFEEHNEMMKTINKEISKILGIEYTIQEMIQ